MPNADLYLSLKQLKHWQQVAFITALAERNLPNYQLFSEICEFGDTRVLRQNLNLLWDCAAGLQSAKNFESQLDLLEENTPDPQKFDNYGAYPALDCCVLINSALSCAMKESLDEVLNATELSLSTVAQLIDFTERLDSVVDSDEDNFDQYIAQHSLYLQELDFQHQLFKLVSQHSNPSKSLIKLLRTLAQNEGVSSIGIAID